MRGVRGALESLSIAHQPGFQLGVTVLVCFLLLCRESIRILKPSASRELRILDACLGPAMAAFGITVIARLLDLIPAP
jgi:hypothetical protein